MKKNFLIFALVAALFALTFEASGQKNKTTNTPVTSTIQDADQNFVPFRIQSDLLGSYKNNSNSVISQIQGIGDWELDMLASPTRRIFVDFGDPVAGNDPSKPPPFSTAYVPARFLDQCSSDLRNLTLNSTQRCRMVIAVDYNSVRYSIRFNAINYPGTTEPLWTCTSAPSGKCSSWRMESDPSGTGKIIGQLLKITTSRNRTVEELLGKYYFSFAVQVTNP